MYSYKIMFRKAASYAVGVLLMLAVFAGFSDLTIKDLIEQYLFPVLGTMTVGGALRAAKNWLKFYTN